MHFKYIHSDKFAINSDGTVTFSVSHFSKFTLMSEKTKVPVVNNPSTTASPNTGDHTNLILYDGLGIVAMIAATVSLVSYYQYW